MTSSAIPIRPVAAGAALLAGLASAVSIVALVRWVWAWGGVAAATWGAASRGAVDDRSWPELTSLARWLEAGAAALAALGLALVLVASVRRRSRWDGPGGVLLHVAAAGVVGLAAATSGRDLLVATGSRTTLVVVAVDAVAVCLAAAAATWETWVWRREVGDRA